MLTEIQELQAVCFRGEDFKARKRYSDGLLRSRTPDETLAILEPHFKRIGLTRLANITGLDRIGIPVVHAVRPNATTMAVASGKGIHLGAAKISAAMEATEIWHAENVKLDEYRASYNEMAKEYPVIPLENLLLIKRSLFHPDRPERWALGWDIANRTDVAVPSIMVIMLAANVHLSASEMVNFQVSSNGLASGNHFLEAVTAGLFEVVERDAVAQHRFTATKCNYHIPRVRLETIEYPVVCELIERLNKADVRLILFDCTVDTEVPVYMAFIYDTLTRYIGMYRGYGAHLNPEIAMVRAITEAIQARCIYISGSRDDFFRHHLLALKTMDDGKAIRTLESSPAVVDAREKIYDDTFSYEEDILLVTEKLKKAGLHQVIVFDLNFSGMDISVVRVVVPGLEGYMFDYYEPGRRANNFYERIRSQT